MGFYEENFKTPLIILGSKQPAKIYSHKASQLDIAPFILKELGLSADTHFIGKSLIDESPRLIPLVQPYSGGYVAIVKNNYKFVYHIKNQQKYFYNLSKDPLEKHNIFSTTSAEQLAEFEKALSAVSLNDYLLESNRIFP